MKSTSGYCFKFHSGVFSWCSKKQNTVAQSTAEDEFTIGTATADQALWLRKVLEDLNPKQENAQKFLLIIKLQLLSQTILFSREN